MQIKALSYMDDLSKVTNYYPEIKLGHKKASLDIIIWSLARLLKRYSQEQTTVHQAQCCFPMSLIIELT